MKPLLALAFVCAAAAAHPQLHAQDAKAPAAPAKDHGILDKFVGEWESEAEGSMVEGQPTMKAKATIRSRKLGDYWVISDVETDMAGTKISAVQTIGYDEKSKKYIGTWVDSMMDHMWKYEGTIDSDGKVLTLEAEGPDFFAEGKTRKYRDVYEFVSKDHIVARSQMLSDDGKWVTFMTGHARRKK
jgi:hypothetical protein